MIFILHPFLHPSFPSVIYACVQFIPSSSNEKQEEEKEEEKKKILSTSPFFLFPPIANLSCIILLINCLIMYSRN